MARCSKCGADSADEPKLCPSCGAKFVAIPPPVPVPGGEPGLFYCHKHKKEPTRTSCGRCERPVCPKCIVIGPAGIRCKECAKRRVALRPRGIAHDAMGGLGNVGQSRVWYVVIWLLLLNLVSGLFGGRRNF